MNMSSLEKPAGSAWQRAVAYVKRSKSKMPFNGDWLFVTEDNTLPQSHEKEQLLAEEKWETPSEVFQKLETEKLEVVKLIYERAKTYEAIVNSRADHVRDKAKSLLGTVSFVSAVLGGVASFLTTSIVKLNGWWFVGELVLLVILGGHLIRALLIAMDVMTREVVITSRKEEFLLPKSETELHALKCSISQIVTYANQTNELVWARVNQLILGQTAFRYGLLWFSLLLGVQIFAGKAVNEIDAKAKANLVSQTEIQSSILAKEEQLLEELRQMKVEIIRIHQAHEDWLKKTAGGQSAPDNKEVRK